MDKVMRIGNAYKEIEGNLVRLCADIDNEGHTFKMFFETDVKYEPYISDEYSDPFALMSIEYCMAKGINLECEQEMTDTLYYNMTQFFIPLLSDNTKTFNKINLVSDTKICSGGGIGVGTGLSCGVDSLHCIHKYKDFPIEKYRLTHLIFANNGAMGPTNYSETKMIFDQEAEHVKRAAEDIGLELILVNTNMMQLYGDIATHRANNNEGLKLAAIIYFLRNLFKIYYVASAFGIDKFSFSDMDVGYFAPFTADMISTEDVRFYIGDLDTAYRINKVENICKWDITKKYLHVNTIKNITHSPKAIRTQMELYVLGCLDEYDAVFEVKKFKRYKAFYWGRNLGDKKEWQFGYNQETIKKARENKVWLPITSWLWALGWIIGLRPMKTLKNTIKKWKSKV